MRSKRLSCVLLATGILVSMTSCGGPQAGTPPPVAATPALPAAGAPAAPGAAPTQSAAADTADPKTYRLTLTGNWFMDTRIAFVMDGIWSGMGNLNEILDTARRIRHTSELSYFREWTKTADWVLSLAEQSMAGGHGISAGHQYLRAAQYYLAAEVMLHTNPDDPRILSTYRKGGDCFFKGLTLLGEPVELLAIPYEGTTLRGYFFRARGGSGRKPTLIVHQGYDAPVESTRHIADAAIERGYNCLLFEGPGQGLVLREKGLPFRPDWESVVTPVIDYIVRRPDVDSDSLILMGISMGGGFAARAAAYEHRLKILVLNPGYVSFYDLFKDILPEKLVNLYEEDPQVFNDKALDELGSYDVGARWGMHHGMWVFGAATPAEFIAALEAYDFTDAVPQIRATTVVMDGTGEQYGAGQSKRLYDLLTCPKHFMVFTEEEHAADHCQVGAPGLATERLFNWLDDNL